MLVRLCKLLRYVDKRTVSIMKGCIERNHLQVELIRCRKIVYFIPVYFFEAMDSMQYHPLNANQDVSNTKHFGSVSDSLGRLAVACPCMASSCKIDLL